MSIAFKANGLITFTTDFGLQDPYVGMMKGAVLKRCPTATLIDLTHQVPAYQADLAGFWLARTWPYFPIGTVHLAVVDPGVGTERAMVALVGAGHVFIAPDNGLLAAVHGSLPQANWRVFGLADLAHLQLDPASNTFHGRDIFAPLVAELAAGRQSIEALGQPVTREAPPALASSQGCILWADHFGNLITSLSAAALKRFVKPAVQFKSQQFPVRPTYGSAAPGELLALVNSWGTLEIALVNGNAQQRLQPDPGEAVELVELAATPHSGALGKY